MRRSDWRRWVSEMRGAQALREAALALGDISDTARLDAELLMAEALGTSRSELLLHHGGTAVPAGFAALLERRMRHEPVAYILGRQEFYGREFLVTSDVLIPRADSETLIAAALECSATPRRILDCGTGSGALLLTLLAERPEAQGVGVDASLGALAVAAANAARLDLAGRARLLRRDWTEAGWREGLGRFDLILANPPYVESGAVLAPGVAEWEPAAALYAGPDGLDDYRMLVPQLPALLMPGGIACIEIGAEQARPVSVIAAQAGFSSVLRRDLAGRPRALVMQLGLAQAADPG